MKKRRLQKSFAVLMAASLVVAACGGDDDDDTSADDTSADEADDGGDETAEEPADDAEEPADDAEEPADEGDEAAPETAPEEVVTEVTEAPDEESGEDKYGGSVAVALEAEATGLRPWEDSCSSPCYNMMGTIYDKLIEQNVDGEYEGWLAESYEPNEDFTVWTLTLRPGVTFHDGTELTAQTIADMFPIQLEGAAGSSAVAASTLENVEATGDLEVTYTLSAPNSAFPSALSRAPLGFVFQPEAAAADPDGFSTSPIGTGPFAIESRDLDNETVVVRNENYWGTDPDGNQLPYLDSISFRPIPDEGTRLDALLSGTTQVFQTLRQGTIRDARAERDGGADIELLEFQGNNTGGGMFNVLVPPFDDVRVRQALTMMNSQENVIEALGGTGISLPATQWFSPDSPWYSQAVADAWPEFDFEGGQALLQEYVDDPERSDGKAPGEPIDVELSCPPDPSLIAAMQVLEQTWSGSGLANVTLTNFDQQTHINNALGLENGLVGTHHAHCWRWADDNDPAAAINVFVGPPTAEIAAEVGAGPSAQNFSNWWSPESFQAALDAIGTDDFEERKALYEQIMMAIATEFPIWYSGHTAMAFGVDPSVKGLINWHLPSGSLGVGIAGVEGRWDEVYLSES